ncbi:hypothetical protein EJB05_04081, partial [Eragrostis curvula]
MPMGAARDVAVRGLALAVITALMACRCAAQASSGTGCMPELVSLSPCMDYMSGNVTTPDGTCCSSLSGVLKSSPRCLCMVVGGTAASLGVAIDSDRALQLPGACKVKAPPASQCDAAGVPSPSPAAGTTTPDTPAASAPSDANSTPAGSGSKATPTSTIQNSDGNISRPRMILVFVGVSVMALLHHRYMCSRYMIKQTWRPRVSNMELSPVKVKILLATSRNIKAQASSALLHRDARAQLTMEQSSQGAPRAVEVTLRRFELSDVDAMMVWASDPLVAAVCRWDAYESTEPLLAFISDIVLPHPWFRAICLAGDDRPVGAVSVSPTEDPCRAELGYVLARAHWGKGVATAAVKRTVATVFDEMEGLERVEALVDVANPASQRVLEKAGFTREAELRKYGVIKGAVKDMVMFSFINTDPLVE